MKQYFVVSPLDTFKSIYYLLVPLKLLLYCVSQTNTLIVIQNVLHHMTVAYNLRATNMRTSYVKK